MNEDTERKAQAEGTTLEGDVEDVTAQAVTIVSSTAQKVDAQTATVEQSAALEVKADSVEANQSAIGKIEAASVQVEEGAVGLIKAEAVTVSGGRVLGAYANMAHLERSNVVFLAARNVGGEARILLNWQAAAALGAGIGLALGLLGISLGRERD